MSQDIRDWFSERVAEHLSHGETDLPEIGRKIAVELPGNRLRDFAEWAAPQMVRGENHRVSARSGEVQREASQSGLMARQGAAYVLSQADGSSVLAADATAVQLRSHAEVLEAHGRSTLSKADFWRSEADELAASKFKTYGDLLSARRAA